MRKWNFALAVYLVFLFNLTALLGSIVGSANASTITTSVINTPVSLSENKLDLLFQKVEKEMVALRDNLEEKFKERCQPITQCSYLACSTAIPDFECFADFVTSKCSCFNPTGTNLSSKTFTAHLANYFSDLFTDINDERTKEFANTMQKAIPSFIDIAKANSMYKWIYFGSSNGSFLRYPGGLNQCTRVYDNRIRPWYISASTGAKNIILILDFSGSMTSEYRADILKKAAKMLISNLVITDFVGIVIMKSFATKYDTALVRATTANKAKLIDFLDNLYTSGATNISAAFQAANEILENSNGSSSCKTFVMFFTDGTPTNGITNADDLMKFIEGLTYLKEAIINSYALGNTSDSIIPKRISCLRNGIFELILDTTEITKRMNTYSSLLSLGMNISKPIWVEPYLDSSGLGQMTTCSIPVYDRSVSPQILIGVIGIDILIKDFLLLGSESDLNKKIIERSQVSCQKSSLTACQMDLLRDKTSKCLTGTSTCSLPTDFQMCDSPLANAFCGPKAPAPISTLNDCCGTTPQNCTVNDYVASSSYQVLSFFYILLLFLI